MADVIFINRTDVKWNNTFDSYMIQSNVGGDTEAGASLTLGSNEVLSATNNVVSNSVALISAGVAELLASSNSITSSTDAVLSLGVVEILTATNNIVSATTGWVELGVAVDCTSTSTCVSTTTQILSLGVVEVVSSSITTTSVTAGPLLTLGASELMTANINANSNTNGLLDLGVSELLASTSINTSTSIAWLQMGIVESLSATATCVVSESTKVLTLGEEVACTTGVVIQSNVVSLLDLGVTEVLGSTDPIVSTVSAAVLTLGITEDLSATNNIVSYAISDMDLGHTEDLSATIATTIPVSDSGLTLGIQEATASTGAIVSTVLNSILTMGEETPLSSTINFESVVSSFLNLGITEILEATIDTTSLVGIPNLILGDSEILAHTIGDDDIPGSPLTFDIDLCTSPVYNTNVFSSPCVYSDDWTNFGPQTAFDDLWDNAKMWHTGGCGNPSWISFKFSSGERIEGYTVRAYGSAGNAGVAPMDWTFQGSSNSTDGSDGDWTILDNVTGETSWGSGEKRSFSFSSTVSYTHYKLNVTASNGSYNGTVVGEIEMMEALTWSSDIPETFVESNVIADASLGADEALSATSTIPTSSNASIILGIIEPTASTDGIVSVVSNSELTLGGPVTITGTSNIISNASAVTLVFGVDEDLAHTSFSILGGGGESGNLFIDGEDVIEDENGTHTITSVGDVAINTSQKKYGDSSIYFDGSGDYLSIPDSTDWDFGTADFTFDSWIYLTVDTQDHIIFNQGSGYPSIHYFVYNGNYNRFSHYCATHGAEQFNVASNIDLSLNTWYHVALVRKNGMFYVYVDGDVINSYNYPAVDISGIEAPMLIGSIGNHAAANFWRGYLDNIRFTKGTAIWSSNFSTTNDLDYPVPTSVNIISTDVQSSTTPILTLGVTELLASTIANASVTDAAVMGIGGSEILACTTGANIVSTVLCNTIDLGVSEPLSSTINPVSFAVVPALLTGENEILNVSASAVSDVSNPQLTLGTSEYMSSTTGITSTVIAALILGSTEDLSATINYNTNSDALIDLGVTEILADVDNALSTSVTGELTMGGGIEELSHTLFEFTSGPLDPYAVTSSIGLVDLGVDEILGVSNSATSTATATLSFGTTEDLSHTLSSSSGTYGDLFIDGETIIEDENGNHTININGDTSINTSIKKYGNSSIYFDGTGDYLTVPSSTDWNFGTDDFTIDFWIYHTSSGVNDGIICNANGVDNNTEYLRIVVQTANAIEFRLRDGASGNEVNVNSNAIVTNQWVHVACIRESGFMHLFIDGTEQGTSTASSHNVQFGTTEGLKIGLRRSSDYLKGNLDNIRITKGTALWTSNFNVSNDLQYYIPEEEYVISTVDISDVTIGIVEELSHECVCWTSISGLLTTGLTEILSSTSISNSVADAILTIGLTESLAHTIGDDDLPGQSLETGDLFIDGESVIQDENAVHTITPVGDVAVNTGQYCLQGNSASSIYFDGNGDYLTIPDSSDWNFGSDDWTIDYWLYVSDTSSTDRVMSQTDTPVSFYSKVDGTFYIDYIGSANIIFPALTGSDLPANNTWNHYAYTKNGETISRYINGYVKGSGTGNNGSHNKVAGQMVIGASTNFGAELTGYIDNFRITKGTSLWSSDFDITSDEELLYETSSTPETFAVSVTSSLLSLGAATPLSATKDVVVTASASLLSTGITEVLASTTFSVSVTTAELIIGGVEVLSSSITANSNISSILSFGVDEPLSATSTFISNIIAPLDLGDTEYIGTANASQSTTYATLTLGIGEVLSATCSNVISTDALLGFGIIETASVSTTFTSTTEAILTIGHVEDLSATSGPSTEVDADVELGGPVVVSGSTVLIQSNVDNTNIILGVSELLGTTVTTTSTTDASLTIGVDEPMTVTCIIVSNTISWLTIGVSEELSATDNITIDADALTPSLGVAEPLAHTSYTTGLDISINQVIFDGDGSADHEITGVGFKPDLVWIKPRDYDDNHNVFDSVRGSGRFLRTNHTLAEVVKSTTLQSFDNDGFTLGSDNESNRSGISNVAWCWKADQTGNNDNGSGLSQVEKYSTDSGLSIITYTGNGVAGRTIKHSLGNTPKFFMTKRIDGNSSWLVYSAELGATKYMKLEENSSETTSYSPWGDTEPTSANITLGNSNSTNVLGNTYVAYIFDDIPGLSDFGQYAGNGSATGPIVDCGFEPGYVMIKSYNQAASWWIFDNDRDSTAPNSLSLAANISSVETTTLDIEFTSTGFQIKTSHGEVNDASFDFIYLAFQQDSDQISNTITSTDVQSLVTPELTMGVMEMISSTIGPISTTSISLLDLGVSEILGSADGIVSNVSANLTIGGSIEDLSHTLTTNIIGTPGDLFIDGEFIIEDETGTHTITNHGNVAISTNESAQGNSSIVFDGDGDALEIANHTDFQMENGDFTIDFWMYDHINDSGQHRVIESSDNTAYNGWLMQLYQNKLRIDVGDGSSWVISDWGQLPIAIDTWYHIAFVREGNVWTLYSNGTEFDSITVATTVENTTAPLLIGANYNTYAIGFNGYFDNIRITKGSAIWSSDFNTATDLDYPGKTINTYLADSETTSLITMGADEDLSSTINLTTASDGSIATGITEILGTSSVSVVAVDAILTIGIIEPLVHTSPSSGGGESGNLFIDGEDVIEDENGTHTITNTGVDISTVQKKYGTSSLYFSGTVDKLTIPDHEDFNLGTSNFTFDVWVYFDLANSYHTIYEQRGVGIDDVDMWVEGSNLSEGSIVFTSRVGGSKITEARTSVNSVTANTWTHIAFVRYGTGLNNFSIYVDGISQSISWGDDMLANTSFPNIPNDPTIGYGASTSTSANGYLDNFRLTKGSALWTSNFDTSTDMQYVTAGSELAVSNVIGDLEIPGALESLAHTCWETTGSGYTIDQCTGGIAASSSDYSTGYQASYAFDDDNNSFWNTTIDNSNNNFPHWIRYDFGTGNEKQIEKISITQYQLRGPDDFTFEGSNNGVDWTTLSTYTGETWASDGTSTYEFINGSSYRFYRIYMTSAQDGGDNEIGLREVEMMENASSTTINVIVGQSVANAISLDTGVSEIVSAFRMIWSQIHTPDLILGLTELITSTSTITSVVENADLIKGLTEILSSTSISNSVADADLTLGGGELLSSTINAISYGEALLSTGDDELLASTIISTGVVAGELILGLIEVMSATRIVTSFTIGQIYAGIDEILESTTPITGIDVTTNVGGGDAHLGGIVALSHSATQSSKGGIFKTT